MGFKQGKTKIGWAEWQQGPHILLHGTRAKQAAETGSYQELKQRAGTHCCWSMPQRRIRNGGDVLAARHKKPGKSSELSAQRPRQPGGAARLWQVGHEAGQGRHAVQKQTAGSSRAWPPCRAKERKAPVSAPCLSSPQRLPSAAGLRKQRACVAPGNAGTPWAAGSPNQRQWRRCSSGKQWRCCRESTAGRRGSDILPLSTQGCCLFLCCGMFSRAASTARWQCVSLREAPPRPSNTPPSHAWVPPSTCGASSKQ